MTDGRQRELIARGATLLGDRFREDFSPAEAFALLAATLEHLLAALDHDDALQVLAGFRQTLDQFEQRRSPLH